MPLVVTDSDVLSQIALDDAAQARIQAQIGSMGASVPARTLAAWNADSAAYTTWSTAAKARLSGGFFAGEWVGVPADGNAAIAWQNTFNAYQAILDAVSKGQTPSSLTPPVQSLAGVSDANTGAIVKGATGAVANVAKSLETPLGLVAIAAVALAVGAVVLNRK